MGWDMEEAVIGQWQLPASFSMGFRFFPSVSAFPGLCGVPESYPGARGLL